MEGKIEVNKKDLHSLKSTLAAVTGYIQFAQKKSEECNDEHGTKVNEMLVKALEAAESLEKQIRKLEGIEEPLMDL